ncbi:MAG: helix-turn-helix domain-containing protein [Micropruina sp.]
MLDVGFPALTFAAVRERLGVGETTLYRYARDRDELVRLGLDHAIEQVDWPPLTGPWRELLESYALAAWHAWAAHPGSATEAARGIVPLGIMRLMDDVCAQLIRQGFTPRTRCSPAMWCSTWSTTTGGAMSTWTRSCPRPARAASTCIGSGSGRACRNRSNTVPPPPSGN